MDPQKLSQLDPKLRDAYQRVMGTSIPQPKTAATQTPTSAPAPTIQEPPVPQPQPVPPQPLVSEPQPAIPQPEPPPVGGPTPQSPVQSAAQASNFAQMNSEVSSVQSSPNFSAPAPMNQAQTIPQEKKNHLMPILIVIVIFVFIAVYTLVWTKIFNFKLPFLPF